MPERPSTPHSQQCDSSPNRHATAHWHVHPTTPDPLVRTGEDWWWCYADQLFFEVLTLPQHRRTL
jgi:hypothetical protein